MQKLPPDMDREDIKAAIRKTGITLHELSVGHGYSSNAVGCALMRPWPAVQQIIAQHIDRRPQDIWPSRYDKSGAPRRRLRSAEGRNSLPALSLQRQKIKVV